MRVVNPLATWTATERALSEMLGALFAPASVDTADGQVLFVTPEQRLVVALDNYYRGRWPDANVAVELGLRAPRLLVSPSDLLPARGPGRVPSQPENLVYHLRISTPLDQAHATFPVVRAVLAEGDLSVLVLIFRSLVFAIEREIATRYGFPDPAQIRRDFHV